MFYPVLFLLLLSIVGFYLNKNKSVYLSKNQKLASLPAYYGYLAFLYIFVPAIIIWLGLLIGKSFILQNYLILTLGDSLSIMNSDEIKFRINSIYKNKLSIGTYVSVTSAFNAAKYDQMKDSLLLVYGSFYTVSEALKAHLLEHKKGNAI